VGEPDASRGDEESERRVDVGTHPIHPGYAGIPTFFQSPYGDLSTVRARGQP
jgi:hypothetical protein